MRLTLALAFVLLAACSEPTLPPAVPSSSGPWDDMLATKPARRDACSDACSAWADSFGNLETSPEKQSAARRQCLACMESARLHRLAGDAGSPGPKPVRQ